MGQCAAEKFNGWPTEQAIGRPVREGIGAVIFAAEREDILAGFERGEPVQRPILQHHCDGRTLIIEGNAVPVHAPDGTLVGYIAVVRDVTTQARLYGDLAESEAKYRNLVELSPDAIMIHQHGAIVFANPAAALVGAGESGDLIGRPVLEVVRPSDRKNVEWNISVDLRGKKSPIATVDLIRRDGTTVTVQG